MGNLNKSLSSYNVLRDRLAGKPVEANFFKFIFQNRKYLTLCIDYYDYLRGKIFIEDLIDSHEDVPHQFDLAVLIYLLYKDFLNQVKQGVEHKQIADFLLSSKKKYSKQEKVEKRVLKPISKHVFNMETYEEPIETNPDQEADKKAYLDIRIRESELLRAEVLLHDISEHLKGQSLSVEDLLTFLYLDFINLIKSKGNTTHIQKNILFHIKQYF